MRLLFTALLTLTVIPTPSMARSYQRLSFERCELGVCKVLPHANFRILYQPGHSYADGVDFVRYRSIRNWLGSYRNHAGETTNFDL